MGGLAVSGGVHHSRFQGPPRGGSPLGPHPYPYPPPPPTVCFKGPAFAGGGILPGNAVPGGQLSSAGCPHANKVGWRVPPADEVACLVQGAMAMIDAVDEFRAGWQATREHCRAQTVAHTLSIGPIQA